MAYCFFGVSILHMETAFKVFSFVHGYVIIFEFKIFATSKFRALRDFAKKMLRKSGMRDQRMQKRQIISCAVQRCMKMSFPSLFQALVRNGKAESQLIEKIFLH